MVKIKPEVSTLERIQIIGSTLIKLVRGLCMKPFFHSSRSLLLIGKHVSIKNIQRISVGRHTKFEDYAEIQGLSRKGIILGDNVTIGRSTMIRPSSYYGTGEIGAGLEMGNNSSIGPLGYIGCAGKIIIGDNVMIGPRVGLFAENHNFRDTDKLIKEQGVSNKGIIIEDNCWIGSGVVVLDGVTIQSGSVIAAGTVVTKNVPTNSIVYDKKNKVTHGRLM